MPLRLSSTVISLAAIVLARQNEPVAHAERTHLRSARGLTHRACNPVRLDWRKTRMRRRLQLATAQPFSRAFRGGRRSSAAGSTRRFARLASTAASRRRSTLRSPISRSPTTPATRAAMTGNPHALPYISLEHLQKKPQRANSGWFLQAGGQLKVQRVMAWNQKTSSCKRLARG
eukprot:6205970-Pleurochrysis_carterae.AAC.10